MRILSKDDVLRVYDMGKAVAATERAFAAHSRGDSQVPVRVNLETAHGSTLFMPGAAGSACGCKVVCVRSGNRARGLPTIPALYVDVDEETGVPAALVDGQMLTYFRTGAASGVAAKFLAKNECKTLLVIGTGVQGTAGCEAVLCVRKF